MDTQTKSFIQNRKKELEQIAKNNAITYIGLFGSSARGDQKSSSDIDVLLRFDFSQKSIGLFELYHIQKQLEDVLGKEVDVVTKPNKFVQPYIERDLVTIYER